MGITTLVAMAASVAIYVSTRGTAPPECATTRLTTPWLRSVDGVSDLAIHCDTLFVAGATKIGRQYGGFVRYRRGINPSEPSVNPVLGEVSLAIPDGRGGWFLSGEFERIGVHECPHLAHMLGTGHVDPGWCPNPNGSIHDLAVVGDSLFVAGDFTRIAGARRLHLAALDVQQPLVRSWRLNPTGPPVYDRGTLIQRNVRRLVVVGHTVFVSGFFEQLGGVARRDLAAIDGRNGHVLRWNADGGYSELGLLAGDRGVLYVNTFDRSGKEGLGRLDLRTGAVHKWPLRFTFRDPIGGVIPTGVTAVARHRDRLFVVGDFDSVNDHARSYVAALNATTGSLLRWRPRIVAGRIDAFNANGTVSSVVTLGDRVYIAGTFRGEDGRRRTVAALDVGTGRVRRWQPGDGVEFVASDGTDVAVGGRQIFLGAAHRRGLAAVDLRTGRVLDWNPRFELKLDNGEVASASVGTLAISDGRLYVGGRFTGVGGERRSSLAAFDLGTLRLNDWAPTAIGAEDAIEGVTAIATTGNTVYAGGDFAVPRASLVAFDAHDAKPREWEPLVESGLTYNRVGSVGALAIDDNSLYASGEFARVGGHPYAGVVRLDLETGKPLGRDLIGDVVSSTDAPAVTVVRDPATDSLVYLAYASGTGFAALERVDEGSGSTPEIRISGSVPDFATGVADFATAPVGDTLFVAGTFSRLDGKLRPGIAAVHAHTGRLLPWVPPKQLAPSEGATAVTIAPGVIVIGGAELIALRSALTG